MTQHASLSPERWAAFSLDQQILMIGNEMNRGMHTAAFRALLFFTPAAAQQIPFVLSPGA